MKKIYLMIIAGAMATLSCTKTTTPIVNNFNILQSSQPPFSINGLHAVTFTNNFLTAQVIDLSVNYIDSAQESLHLSFSGLPAGVTVDSNWISSGVPSFETSFTLRDSTDNGIVPGDYEAKLLATTASGRIFSYPFHIVVSAMPTSFLGKYDSCQYYCGTPFVYRDSLWQDAGIPNKVWFSNYLNSGNHVYGYVRSRTIIIPSQTVGGQLYSASCDIFMPHSINISLSSSCAINMR